MVACPYFVVFELLGPAIELIGYVVVPLAWSLGILSPVFLLAFVTVAILLGVLLSIAALVLEELSFRRHPRGSDVVRMLVWAVLENIGYRQLIGVMRVLAFVDVVRGRSDWGVMDRRGPGDVAVDRPAVLPAAPGR
jgi:hypothetical protein